MRIMPSTQRRLDKVETCVGVRLALRAFDQVPLAVSRRGNMFTAGRTTDDAVRTSAASHFKFSTFASNGRNLSADESLEVKTETIRAKSHNFSQK